MMVLRYLLSKRWCGPQVEAPIIAIRVDTKLISPPSFLLELRWSKTKALDIGNN